MSDVLVIEAEGADQDNAMVGFEHTATGMRFEIKGALAKALNAEITRLQALLKEAGPVADALAGFCQPCMERHQDDYPIFGLDDHRIYMRDARAARSLSDRIRGV